MQVTLVQCSLRLMGETLRICHSVFEWHKRSKEGHENLEDYERSGHPRYHRTGEYVEKVRNLMPSGRRLSIRAMAVQLNLDKETLKEA